MLLEEDNAFVNVTTAGRIARLGACLLSLPLGLVLSPITIPILTSLDTDHKPSGVLLKSSYRFIK